MMICKYVNRLSFTIPIIVAGVLLVQDPVCAARGPETRIREIDVDWHERIGVTHQELHERAEIKLRTEQLLLFSRFDQLEELATEYRTSREMFSNGEWKLSVFYDGMSYYFETSSLEGDWQNRLQKLEIWVQRNPESVTAHVALAECIISYAFFIKNHKYDPPMPESRMEEFVNTMVKAEEVLLAIEEEGRFYSEWHAAMQRIAVVGWTRRIAARLLKEALEVDLEYNPNYFRMAWYLLPSWMGSPGEWEEFAEMAADKIGGVEGDILYARIIWFMDKACGWENIRESHTWLDWDRVDRGIAGIKMQNDNK